MAKKPELSITINQAMMNYVDTIKLARSEHTARAYKNALNEFSKVLVEKWLDPQTTSVEKLTENLVSAFAAYLNTFSPATEHLYLQAVKGFYEFVDSEGFTEINVSRVRILIRLRSRRPGIRIPQFPVDDIERLLDFVLDAHNLKITNDTNEKLRAMRDRAFLLALADTGLRVHEACNLRRGDVDWNEHQALVVGKGNIQAVVRFTSRSINAIKDYLSLRASIDGASGRPLPSLPIFARHDKGVGKKIKPITPTTGRNIVAERVEEILGKDSAGTITPHSFRHYFVTTALKGSGNLKFAQELARHKNIQVTQRYAHLSDDALDKGYYEIFEKKSQQITD